MKPSCNQNLPLFPSSPNLILMFANVQRGNGRVVVVVSALILVTAAIAATASFLKPRYPSLNHPLYRRVAREELVSAHPAPINVHIIRWGASNAYEDAAMITLCNTTPLANITVYADAAAKATIRPPVGCQVRVVDYDIDALVADTPLQEWYPCNKHVIDGGKYPRVHESDMARLCIVYKHGGAYIDGDTLIVRDISAMRDAVQHETERVYNGYIFADKGSPFLWLAMEQLTEPGFYDPQYYTSAGPELLTTVLKKHPKVTRMMPSTTFTPIPWDERDVPFHHTDTPGVSRYTFGIHLWNKQTHGFSIEPGSLVDRALNRGETAFDWFELN